MTDVGYVIAGYAVILGGMAIYVALLVRRLRNARAAVRHPDDTDPSDAPR